MAELISIKEYANIYYFLKNKKIEFDAIKEPGLYNFFIDSLISLENIKVDNIEKKEIDSILTKLAIELNRWCKNNFFCSATELCGAVFYRIGSRENSFQGGLGHHILLRTSENYFGKKKFENYFNSTQYSVGDGGFLCGGCVQYSVDNKSFLQPEKFPNLTQYFLENKGFLINVRFPDHWCIKPERYLKVCPTIAEIFVLSLHGWELHVSDKAKYEIWGN